MACPFCGTALTIPSNLRWKQAIVAEPPTMRGPAFNPLINARKSEKPASETEFVADALRQAQPLAAGAVSAYALWNRLRRLLPGCLIALTLLCLLACGAGAALLVYLRQGG
jgi:hypothetical protein